MMEIDIKSNWEKYDSLPDGWAFDKTCGSPVFGYVFATNGKSVINGGRRALVAISAKPLEQKNNVKVEIENTIKKEYAPIDLNTRRAMNDLAREKLKEKLLKDLMFDMIVCKIEGWDIREYIGQLHTLIDGVSEQICSKQLTLFR